MKRQESKPLIRDFQFYTVLVGWGFAIGFGLELGQWIAMWISDFILLKSGYAFG